jgi:hypothetical protein
LEWAILFLAKAIASAVVGHYIQKGLTAIDPHFAQLIKRGAPREEIEEYARSSGIEEQVVRFTTQVVDRSFVLPMVPEGASTSEDRSELFLQVLKICYAFSHSSKCDLILPSSIVGPDVCSLFAGNHTGPPRLVRRGIAIDIWRGDVSKENNMLYLLHPWSGTKSEIWDGYKADFLKEREDAIDYSNVKPSSPFLAVGFRVLRVTSGYVYFTPNAPIRKETEELLQLIRVEKAEKGHPVRRARIYDWFGGIQAMVSGLRELFSLIVLSEKEVSEISQIRSGLEHLLGDMTGESA